MAEWLVSPFDKAVFTGAQTIDRLRSDTRFDSWTSLPTVIGEQRLVGYEASWQSNLLRQCNLFRIAESDVAELDAEAHSDSQNRTALKSIAKQRPCDRP